MNRKKSLYIIIGISLLTLTVLPSHAQDKKEIFNPETYAVTSLAIAPDARGGSMGDLGAATDADCNSQYWNPSKYAFNVARAGVSASYTPWLRQLVNDINLAYVSGFYRFGDYNAVSASLRYFSLGEVMIDGDDAMTINPYELAVDLAYSRMLSERFSMGVALRFIYSDITYDYSAESKAGKAFAADISMYRLGYFMMGNRECSFSWGLNISNIGSKISYGGDDNSEFIPTTLRLGCAMTIPFNAYNKLTLAADAYKWLIPTYPVQGTDESTEDYEDRVQRDYYDVSPIAGIFKSFADAPGGFKEEMQEIRYCVGMEYSYDDKFMLRCGYHHENENKGNRKYVTAGAGFHMSVFTIDASYLFAVSQSNPLDQTMRFTLTFDLDGMKDLFTQRKRR